MKIRNVLPIVFLALTYCYSLPGGDNKPVAFTKVSQDRNSAQQTIPPEKKKALPAIGPDEIFGEQNNTGQQNRSASTRQRSAPKPSPAASPTPTAAPAVVSPELLPLAEGKGTPRPLAETSANGAVQSSSSARSSTDWQIPILGVLTFLVLIALLYVLGKLRELLRES